MTTKTHKELRTQIQQADERGDENLRRAHRAEAALQALVRGVQLYHEGSSAALDAAMKAAQELLPPPKLRTEAAWPFPTGKAP